ncbi:LysR family transcriptional regulator [Serratia sp. UGAL515B_01]|uniref:LysR family transcriptional regulator n=1 Tax=Serratia sp. UGAL515B_01 TaxID=2986763 RepID=UPI0029535582|nr:LysR family transcriptional regulator [Serratia sp. UGAL515B_01]WON77376.1 LysR family transcriptional regulator [Serratia sp. UGAL515B_01]
MKSEMSGILVFLVAAETGNFSKAAENLHLTRSAITKTIARLESRLGVSLFNRTTRSQSLTDEGILYYEYCRRAVNEILKAEEILEGEKLQVSGRLRISVPVLFGHLCIAPLLTELMREHSGLELEMSFSDRIVDITEEGFDLAIRIGNLPDSTSLIARKIAAHRMVFCASPSYLSLAGEPTSEEMLSQHAAIAYIRSGRIQKWRAKRADGNVWEITPAARLMMDDMQAVKGAAMAGSGIAWLPYWLARDALQLGALQEILKNMNTELWPIYAVWPRTPRLALKVRVAVDRLVSELPQRMALAEAPFE